MLQNLINRKTPTILNFKCIQRLSYSSIPVPVVDKANQPNSSMENPFKKEKRLCILCSLGIKPSYKNVKLLSQFQSRYTGRIYGRHITGLCKQQQELVESEIRKAQFLAMMPAMHKHVDFLEDPPLFDPQNPIRPHRFE